MRLLLLCATPEFTGPAELMLEDACTLRDAGHEVTIAFDTRRPGSLRERIEALGLPIEESLDLCRIPSASAYVGDVLRLRRLVAEGRYDTLHARFSHDHHLCLAAVAGRKRSGIRLLRSCELVANAARGAARSFAYARTDRVVVPATEQRVALEQNHLVPNERISLVRGRVDAERFTPGPTKLRAELGIPEDAPVVGIVSRIKPDRRHADLLAAFARARRDVPDAHLVVVGRGEGEEALRRQAAAFGDRVRFAGYRTGEALADAYRAFDVKAWLAPGNDGTVRAVLEAMASGCAILGGRFGAVAESVVEGETGLLCDPADREATGRALASLLSDRASTSRMGQAGRRRVLARYTRAQRAEALLAAYRETWERPAAGRIGI